MPILEVKVKDGDTSELTPARVHLQDSKGNFHYPDGCVPYKQDSHFTVSEKFEVPLPPGNVSILVEKGK